MEKAMDYWYILYVKTGEEEKIKKALISLLDTQKCYPFIPAKEVTFRRYGVNNKERQLCFPGYVFIRSTFSPNEFLKRTLSVIRKTQIAYRFLNYGDDLSDVSLRESERFFLVSLMGEGDTIKESTGMIIGQKIKIIGGALFGKEGKIIKVNRHKREGVVELSLVGCCKRITVGLEIIDRVN